MANFGAKVVAFLSIGSLSGLAYMKYSQLSSFNTQAQQMIKTGKLQDYLLNLSQQSSYFIEKMMDNYQNALNQSNLNKYKETLMKIASGNVLETCAGSNRTLKYYLPGTKLTLIDWSPKMASLGMFKTNPCIETNYVIGDVRQMPFADNQFDCVVDIFGLEHVIHPRKALQEIRRVCKKDGTIILMNIGLSSIVEFHYYQNFAWGQKLYNMGIFTNRNWEKIIKEFDFTVQHMERKKNGKVYIHILKNTKQGLQKLQKTDQI